MAKKEYLSDLTAERVRELLDYDPKTDAFSWRIARGNRKAGSQAGCINSDGYRVIRIHGRGYKAHRIAWLIHYGEWPQGEIDHEKGDRDDNRLSRLRDATRQEQCKNQGMRKDNTSGVMGVSWAKDRNKWIAQIRVAGKLRYLGYFTDLADAVAARKKAEQQHGFHSNHGKRLGIPYRRDRSKKRNP